MTKNMCSLNLQGKYLRDFYYDLEPKSQFAKLFVQDENENPLFSMFGIESRLLKLFNNGRLEKSLLIEVICTENGIEKPIIAANNHDLLSNQKSGKLHFMGPNGELPIINLQKLNNPVLRISSCIPEVFEHFQPKLYARYFDNLEQITDINFNT